MQNRLEIIKKFFLFAYKEHRFVMAVTVVTFLIMLFEPYSSHWLRYQSIEINQGQWWRILTANFCHSNWNHWMLNISGFWLMDFFYQPVVSAKIRAQLMSFCMLANVLFIHLLLDVSWYVGLSGALHGFLIGGALVSWNKAKRLNFAIIVVVSGKLIVESNWQINSATEKLINANVLEEAHSLGALSAVIFFVVYLILNRKKADN